MAQHFVFGSAFWPEETVSGGAGVCVCLQLSMALSERLLAGDSRSAESQVSVPYSRPYRPVAPVITAASGVELHPVTGLVVHPNKNIEDRAVSADFLRTFTKEKVLGRHELAREATAAAIKYLEHEIQTVQRELRRFEAATSKVSGGLTRENSARLRQRKKLNEKLDLLKSDLRKRRKRPFLSTRDVHRMIIKPETDERYCRYIELPGWGDRACRGMPFVGHACSFVSHSWDSPWEELVAALCEHAEEHPDHYYWVDIFAVIQHWHTPPDKVGTPGHMATPCVTDCPGCMAAAEDMPDWAKMQSTSHSGGFGQVLSSCSHVLVCMEPWHNPRPPTRVWCLYEMYKGLEVEGGRAEVVLSRLQQQAMQVALSDNFAKFESLILGLDARDAEVTHPSDKDNIFGLIRSSEGSFHALNDAIRMALFSWLVDAGRSLLERVNPASRPLRLTELKEEAERHSYGRCSTCLLRCVNRHPSAIVLIPGLGYLGVSVVSFSLFIYLQIFSPTSLGEAELHRRRMRAFCVLGIGLLGWIVVGLFGMQLYGMRSRHQIRTPPLINVCASSSRAVNWATGSCAAWAAWLCLFMTSYHFRRTSAMYLTFSALTAFFGLLTLLAMDLSQQCKLAMLAVRVAWLLSKMKGAGVGGDGSPQTAATNRNKTAAAELFAEAHEVLQRLLGPTNVGSFLAAPGLIRTLHELGRTTEALNVEQQVTTAVSKALRCHRRCCFNLCHEDGQANWLWRAATVYMDVLMPPIRIESVLADSGRSPHTSRWLWLRAETKAAGCTAGDEEETLTYLNAAVSAGCCFSPLSYPVFDHLQEQVMRVSINPNYQSPDKSFSAPSTDTDTCHLDEENGRGCDGHRVLNDTLGSTVADKLHAIDAIAAGNLRRANVWRKVWAIVGTLLATGMLALQILLMEAIIPWPDLGQW